MGSSPTARTTGLTNGPASAIFSLVEREQISIPAYTLRYPEWIDLLVIAWPKAVLPVIREQLDIEWAAPGNASSLFLYRYGRAEGTIQRPIQLLLIATIASSEANSIATLDNAQRILRRLEFDACQKDELYKVAKDRFSGHVAAGKTDFALSYLGLMLMLDPNAALPSLELWLDDAPAQDQKARAEDTFGNLFDRYDSVVTGSMKKASTQTLEALLRLAYRKIRPKDDVHHEGSYSPDARDHAQNARDAILSILLARTGPDSYDAVRRLADDPVFALRSHRFRELAHGKALRDAEIPPWTAAEVRGFETSFTAPAKTGPDLLRVVLGVLEDIEHNLTKGDFSSRALLERAKDEDEVQPWLAEQMLSRAKNRFHIVREGEIALGDKPDIVVASEVSPWQVAVEIKHGGKGWTATELEQALRVQLAEDYLKPDYRRHGVLVITHHRDRRWQRANDDKKIDFADLIKWLSGLAATIKQNSSGHITVACVGLNAWKGDPATAAAKCSAKKATSPGKRSTRSNATRKRPTSKVRRRKAKRPSKSRPSAP